MMIGCTYDRSGTASNAKIKRQREDKPELEPGDRVDLFGLCTLEGVEHAWVAREHLGKNTRLQVGNDLAGGCHRRVDRGSHVDGAIAVDAPDRGEAATLLDHRHLAERHLAAVGGANSHVLQVTERPAIVPRVAHHHPDVIAPTLDPLRLPPHGDYWDSNGPTPTKTATAIFL